MSRFLVEQRKIGVVVVVVVVVVVQWHPCNLTSATAALVTLHFWSVFEFESTRFLYKSSCSSGGMSVEGSSFTFSCVAIQRVWPDMSEGRVPCEGVCRVRVVHVCVVRRARSGLSACLWIVCAWVWWVWCAG